MTTFDDRENAFEAKFAHDSEMQFLAEARRNLWLAAAIVTGLLWLFVIWSVWRASRHEFSGGADIGLGIMMLFVPVIASIALAVVSLRSR